MTWTVSTIVSEIFYCIIGLFFISNGVKALKDQGIDHADNNSEHGNRYGLSGNLQGIYRISLLSQGGDDQQSAGGTHEAVLCKEVSVVFTSGTHALDIILRLFIQLAILNYGSSLGHRIDQRADELRMSSDTQGEGGCKGTDDLPDGDQAAGGRIL